MNENCMHSSLGAFIETLRKMSTSVPLKRDDLNISY